MEPIIILKGLKQLNECEDNGVNVMIAKENESHLEKYNRQLLLGLKKIRNIANLENQEERLDQLRRLRGRFNRDIFCSYVHYGLNHMAKGEKREKGRQLETIFTNQKKQIGDIEVRMKGWSNNGMREFNKTLRYLISVRNLYEWQKIENELMNEYKEMDDDKSGKKRKRDNNDEILLMDREAPLDAYSLNFVQV